MEKQLPKNWNLVSLEKLGEDKYYAIGDGDHGQIKPSDYKDSGIPYIRVGDLDWGFFKEDKLVYISEEVHNKNLKSELLPGDILIAKTGATIGKCCIVPNHIKKANTTSSVGKVSINKDLTSNKWILYYFLSPDFYKLMWSHSHRTAQPGFNIVDLKNFPVPLPPLPEQNRIVTKLDALFAQLETIKNSMANVPLLLKDFRHQVLTQAFTGKLSQEWRNKKRIKDWNYKKLEKITLKVGSGSTPTGGQAAYLDEGIPLIRSMNVHFNGIKYDGLAYINETQAKGLKNVEVFENDILLNITGASIGRVCLAPRDLIGARVNQHVCIIRVNDELKPSFLNIYLSSPLIQNLINNENYGVTRQSFTKAQILELDIPIPFIDEQEIILNKVESLFVKADAIEKQYEALKAIIDSLPKALLHKAFKGELTEQLDSDGDAKELLREIEALKAKTERAVKGKSVKVAAKKNIGVLEKIKEFK